MEAHCDRSRQQGIPNMHSRQLRHDLVEEKRATCSLGKYLAGVEKSRVLLESCAEAFVVADAARAAGHEVVVVPAKLVRQLGVGDRGIKNDVRDGTAAEQRVLPSGGPTVGAHSKHPVARAQGDVQHAGGPDRGANQTVNTARSWAANKGMVVLRGGGQETFPGRFRRHVASRGRTVPEEVNRVLQALEALNLGILEADKQLAKAAKASDLQATDDGAGDRTGKLSALCGSVGRHFAVSQRARGGGLLGRGAGENSTGSPGSEG